MTGAARGIGRAIALEFACAGADVVLHARGPSAEALAVCEECRQFGRRADLITQDFSGPCDWQVFVDSNNDGFYTPGEVNATTDSSGNYKLTGLLPGTYRIRETRMVNWNRTQPAGAYPLGYYDVTAEEIVAWSRERLGGYKYPRDVHIVDALPLSHVGKLDRKELRSRVPVTASDQSP